MVLALLIVTKLLKQRLARPLDARAPRRVEGRREHPADKVAPHVDARADEDGGGDLPPIPWYLELGGVGICLVRGLCERCQPCQSWTTASKIAGNIS